MERTRVRARRLEVWNSLGLLNKLLTPLIVVDMIVGVAVGASTGEAIPNAFDTAEFRGVSVPIVLGLLLMMWPILTRVQYEILLAIFRDRKVWLQIGLSLIINWFVYTFA